MRNTIKIDSPSAESDAHLVECMSRVAVEESQAKSSYQPGDVVEVRDFNSATEYHRHTVIDSYPTTQYGWVCVIDFPSGRMKVSCTRIRAAKPENARRSQKSRVALNAAPV